jgi:threonine/homoserine/homoserine lactone efflux protein
MRYITTFLLTITNPLTILSFIAIFTSLGYVHESGYTSAVLLIISVWINIGSGLVLILYGEFSISKLVNWSVG